MSANKHRITGNVKVLEKGKLHLITINLGWNNEKKIYDRRRIRFRGKKEDAEHYMDELIDQYRNPSPPVKTYSEITVGEWLLQWVDKYTKPFVAQNTYKRHRGIIVNNINPIIGEIPLVDLDIMNIRDLYAALLSGGEKTRPLSIRSVRYVHVILNKALTEAVDMDIIPFNPVAKVKAPKETIHKPHRWHILSPEELPEFLSGCFEHEDYALINAAAYTGARQSELLGLHWEDILWETNEIRFHRTLHRDPDSATGYEERLSTKNKSSIRTIPVSQTLIDILKKHQAVQKEKKKELERESPLVFTDEQMQPINAGNLSHRFSNLAKRLGHAGMRFHDLRHTHATILLKSGVPVAEVSARLGHSTPYVTYTIYSHVIPGLGKGLADVFDKEITQ